MVPENAITKRFHVMNGIPMDLGKWTWQKWCPIYQALTVYRMCTSVGGQFLRYCTILFLNDYWSRWECTSKGCQLSRCYTVLFLIGYWSRWCWVTISIFIKSTAHKCMILYRLDSEHFLVSDSPLDGIMEGISRQQLWNEITPCSPASWYLAIMLYLFHAMM